MIVTKQRKNSQSNYPTKLKQDELYNSFLQDKQNISKKNCIGEAKFFVDNQTAVRRQRNSLGTVVKTNTRHIDNRNESQKKLQKKYDYSIAFQQNKYRERLNKTHNKIDPYERNSSYKMNQVSQKPKCFQQNQRKRCSSVKNNIPKYRYFDNQPYAKQKYFQAQKLSYFNSTNHQKTLQQRMSLGSQQKSRSISITKKPPMENNYLTSSNKQNRPQNIKSFFGNDNFQNNLDQTQKFLEFKSNMKFSNIPDPKSIRNYQSRYSKMRSNKRAETMNENQNTLNYQNKTQQKILRQSQISLNVNFEQLYKNSQTQNRKITEKIQRISQLNSEINQKLQKMLLNKPNP